MSDTVETDRTAFRRFLRKATHPFYELKRRARRRSALFWRRRFGNTIFVGITGSHGKTTATALLGAMLKATAPTYVRILHNQTKTVARTVLRTLPWRHRYCVQEISAERPTVDRKS